jgi:4-amino-4-deoxy-L-arabinose transferase-like glycosyltransferase
MTLILLLAFGLRLHRLACDSIWWDEGYSIWMARLPTAQMLFETSHDAHPPLSYAMLHGWRLLVGEEEFALRAQSVFFGLLTVALSYQIGREAGGRRAGLAGALLVTLARLPVWWSQEVRMYAPATFFVALALWMALRMFDDRRRLWLPALVLAVGLGAGLLTLYLFAGAVVVLNLAFVIAFFASSRRWKLALAWIAAQAGALALFAPWAIYAIGRLPSWVPPQAPVDLMHVVKLYLSVIFLGVAAGIERYTPLLVAGAIALLVTAAASLIASQRRQRVAWTTLVIGTLLPPLLVYLLSLPRGHFNYPTPSPRYFLLLSTPVYVLLGWGAVALNRRLKHTGSVLLIGLAALSLWSLAQYYPGLHLSDDYLSMAATLEALRQPGDAVVLNNDADWPIFAYHYPHDFDRHISTTQRIRDEKYAEHLLKAYRRQDGVWLVQTRYAAVTDPENYLGEWLKSKAWGRQVYTFPEGELWFFAMKQERADLLLRNLAERWPSAFVPVDAPVADGVRLTGYTQVVPEIRAGDTLVIGLGWHTDDDVKGEWPVALKVIGPGGQEITSTLVSLAPKRKAEGDRFQPVEVFIPPDAPGGRAQVVFTAGEIWQPLGRVRILAREGPSPGSARVPDTATPVDARFGEGIVLAAVDLPDRAAWSPGEGIPLTLYWEAQSPITEKYKVFVHLVGDTHNPASNNTIWGQQDQEPQGGVSPTTSWQPGAVVEDGYLIYVQDDAPPGRYRLQVGLYLPLGGDRLPAFDADGAPLGDSVTIFEVQVIPGG